MNSQPLKASATPKNPDLQHKKQAFYQIFLPLGITTILIITLMVLSGINGVRGNQIVTRWADFSSIMIVIGIMIAGLIVLFILAALVYLIAKLLYLIPPYAHLIQAYFDVAANTIKLRADQILLPLIKIKSWIAGFKNIKKISEARFHPN